MIKIYRNKGIDGWDDKIVGFGFGFWNNPFEFHIDFLFWTISIQTEWRGIR